MSPAGRDLRAFVWRGQRRLASLPGVGRGRGMGRGRSWTALSVVVLAGAQLGCPNSGPTAAERNARLAKARLAAEAADEAQEKADAERLAALGTWPPLRGKPFPDLVLFDQEGKEVKLSSFKGKVILLQWVAATSPGSISQAGGFESDAFQGTPAQPGVWRLDKELKEAKVPVDSEGLVWLQVMVYGPREAVPTQADAQAWAKHFKLAERARTHVLYTDARYQVEATRNMVPGYLVIGPDQTFLYDRANMFAADGYTEVAKGLARLLRTKRPVLPAYSPTVSPRQERLLALAALLKGGKHSELDAEVAKLLALGYRKDAPGRTHLDTISELGTVEGVGEKHFEAWLAASPESFVPAYLKGEAHVKWGWAARGHGYANTVTEEGWAIFGRELQKAKEAYTLANRISSSQAYGYTGLLIVARALSAPDEVREAYFKAAIQADPDYLAAYPESREINRLALKIAKRRKVGILKAAKLLAEQGDPWGMGQYGYYLKWGSHGAKIDLETAHKYLLASGRAGDIIGAGQIAHSLIYHSHFKHDYPRAIPWLKVSAGGGYEYAQELLAESYYLGRGVTRDLAQAAAWYRLASNANSRFQLSKILAEDPKLRRPGDPE